MSPTAKLPALDQVRAQFPALAGETVFLENAGGSQVPGFVADRMHRYLTRTYVQLGAGYPLSQQCTATVDDAHEFARTFVNAGEGQAILGSWALDHNYKIAACGYMLSEWFEDYEIEKKGEKK